MRTWDIIDSIEPNTRITAETRKRQSIVGTTSSFVQIALLLTIGFASSSSTMVRHATVISSDIAVSSKKASQSVPSAAPRGLPRGTDTQLGQSSSKLARAFSAFFQPAPEEEQRDDDYSFA
jgi:hypothetical protein